MSDTTAYGSRKLAQLQHPPSQPAQPRTPGSLIVPVDFNRSTVMNNRPTMYSPYQATSHDPFRFGNTCAQSTDMLFDPRVSQNYHYQQQWQRQAQQQAQLQYPPHLQQQQPNIDPRYQQRRQEYLPSAQNDLRMQQHRFAFQTPDPMQQWQQQQYARQLPRTTNTQPLTPQQTLKQTSGISNVPFEFLGQNHPHFQRSMNSGFKNNTQQFALQSQKVPTPQFSTAGTLLPSPQRTPGRHDDTQKCSSSPIAAAPQLRNRSAASLRTGAANRNEGAERDCLSDDRQQEYRRRAKRRAELLKDTSAIYRNYDEYLEYFPLARGEQPSPYLAGLLANQPVPTEPTSDLGLAVQYARHHWENFWEKNDLKYVVQVAKQKRDKNVEGLKRTYEQANDSA